MAKQDYLRISLVTAFAIETLCATYFIKIPSLAPFFSIVYFIAGISIAALIIVLPKPDSVIFNKKISCKPVDWFKFFLIAITGFFIFYYARVLMSGNPIDYRNADMLPVIKTMNQRFLNGQWKHVYDSIPEIWNGSKPIYLPGMWLPFTPAVFLNIDVRWVTVACLFFVFVLPVLLLAFRQRSSIVICLIAATLLWWLLSENDTHGFIIFSEEGIVVLYYSLLVVALISENIFFISIVASMCMLSRYSLIGWMPAFFIFLLLCKKRKQALAFSGTSALFFLFLFIIPFGWNAFLRLIQLPSYYIDFAKRVWHDSPETFSDYIGFAKFFVPDKMHLLHTLLISLSFIMPTAFIVLCNYYKKKRNLYNIPLAALKFAIVIFYNFIDVPYLYLFYTSSFVSLLIAVFFAGRENNEMHL
jgi:hypothetical protein